MSIGTRSEVKKFIKSGRVFVNETKVLKPEYRVGDEDVVLMDGERVIFAACEYYMLNKPQGVVSATKDRDCETVISLLSDRKRKDLFPVGRLDKDTEGLLLITNDGELAHRLLSPKNHVWKTYLVKALGSLSREDVLLLEQGLDIGDETKTLPAKVTILQQKEIAVLGQISEDDVTWLKLSVCEGRYHQVKRMMAAVNHPVLYLKRLAMGELQLDPALAPGQYRPLKEEEQRALQIHPAEGRFS
jgi:16S rRNA pseudouridine516 synthase